MELTKGDKTEIDAKRVELIRELCAGEGANTKARWVERKSDLKALFGDYEDDLLTDLIDAAFDAMPKSPFKAALVNAWEAKDGKNLTERRTDFLEENGSISYRTLIRHEQEGAELLVKYFDLVEAQYLKEQEEEASEDAARDADLEVMRRRLTKLESSIMDNGELLSRVADLELTLKYTSDTLSDLIDMLRADGIYEFAIAEHENPTALRDAQRRLRGNAPRDWQTGKAEGLPESRPRRVTTSK